MRIDSPKVSAPEPPRALAWYMAASALESSSAVSSTPKVLRATPTEASRKTSDPSTMNGSANDTRTRSMKADALMWAVPAPLRKRARNSSPPNRAMTSASPATFWRRAATDARTRSPKSWPMVLLMVLNRSRSIRTTATEPGTPRQSVTAEVSRSPKWTRLGSPVSRSSRRARSRQGPEPSWGGDAVDGTTAGRMKPPTQRAAPCPVTNRRPSTGIRWPSRWSSSNRRWRPLPAPVHRGSSRAVGGGRRRGRPAHRGRPGAGCPSPAGPPPRHGASRTPLRPAGFHSMTVPVLSTSRKGSGHRATNPVQR